MVNRKETEYTSHIRTAWMHVGVLENRDKRGEELLSPLDDGTDFKVEYLSTCN